MKVPISVLIPVRNEAVEILACLESVQWADEVVVIDSHSTDDTASLAASRGARVVQFTYIVGGPKKKNWALEHVSFRHPWVLILDADERITPKLADEIRNTLASPVPVAGYYVNRRFFFAGSWIQYAGYYPSWNLRLFQHKLGRYERVVDIDTQSGDNEVHEHVVLGGPVAYLKEPMDHYAFRTIEQFVEKHNRYSNWESMANEFATRSLAGRSNIDRALNARRQLKQLARRFPFPHWLRFFYHYFLKLGFLDGKQGYLFCHLLAEYEFLIWAKGLERRRLDGRSIDFNRL